MVFTLPFFHSAAMETRGLTFKIMGKIPKIACSWSSWANAAGVPVIAMDLGSCREVIKDGQTGFLVNNVSEAVRALERLSEIDRTACRQRVQQCFSIKTMVEAYERVYSTIFDLEAKRRP